MRGRMCEWLNVNNFLGNFEDSFYISTSGTVGAYQENERQRSKSNFSVDVTQTSSKFKPQTLPRQGAVALRDATRGCVVPMDGVPLIAGDPTHRELTSENKSETKFRQAFHMRRQRVRPPQPLELTSRIRRRRVTGTGQGHSRGLSYAAITC